MLAPTLWGREVSGQTTAVREAANGVKVSPARPMNGS
jgi:hypothetical protein